MNVDEIEVTTVQKLSKFLALKEKKAGRGLPSAEKWANVTLVGSMNAQVGICSEGSKKVITKLAVTATTVGDDNTNCTVRGGNYMHNVEVFRMDA